MGMPIPMPNTIIRTGMITIMTMTMIMFTIMIMNTGMRTIIPTPPAARTATFRICSPFSTAKAFPRA